MKVLENIKGKKRDLLEEIIYNRKKSKSYKTIHVISEEDFMSIKKELIMLYSYFSVEYSSLDKVTLIIQRNCNY